MEINSLPGKEFKIITRRIHDHSEKFNKRMGNIRKY